MKASDAAKAVVWRNTEEPGRRPHSLVQIKNNKQRSPMARGGFLVSMTPEAVEWNLVFKGVEIAVISGDPNQAGSPFVIRVKHRDGTFTEWVEL
jgi:hypothetical protein